MADRQFERARKKLAAALKRKRLELGLSQEEAADRIGIAPRHYQKLEAGAVNVTLRTLTKAAVGLKTDVADLLVST